MVHPNFKDEVAVNIPEDSEDKDKIGDELFAGLYVVRPTVSDIDKSQFLSKRDKVLKIIVLLC